jgi:hypothetical protein
MKRIPIYIVLIALVFVVPLNRVDVGTLQPVEILAISKDNNLLVCDKDRLDKTFRKGGTTQKYTVLKIGYDTDSEFESADLEELPFT